MGTPIANLELTNTFDEWRTTTNQLIYAYGANLAYFTSNSAALSVTSRFIDERERIKAL